MPNYKDPKSIAILEERFPEKYGILFLTITAIEKDQCKFANTARGAPQRGRLCKRPKGHNDDMHAHDCAKYHWDSAAPDAQKTVFDPKIRWKYVDGLNDGKAAPLKRKPVLDVDAGGRLVYRLGLEPMEMIPLEGDEDEE